MLINFNVEFVAECALRPTSLPFSGFEHQQTPRLKFFDVRLQTGSERIGFTIIHFPTVGAQSFCVMPHRRQYERDFMFVITTRAHTLQRFDHDDNAFRLFAACRRQVSGEELVAQNENGITLIRPLLERFTFHTGKDN